MGNETVRRPLVLVLAGSGYGQQAPLLWWTSEIAAAAGCEVVAPRWQVDDAAGADPVGFVETAVAAALGDRLPDLVVAKSFGCFALPWAIRHEVPGVWLTPVLTHDDVATALAAATDVHVAMGVATTPCGGRNGSRGLLRASRPSTMPTTRCRCRGTGGDRSGCRPTSSTSSSGASRPFVRR
ncbi:hypothetical protein JYQ29_04040 [Curtobacterium flaccumfaciens pv. flaccumfaciens]|uniref:hypothetical protein n=1 Tax=Curtobacterium flaccumfaciens TaxID=2035 RepID=UPI001ADABA0B|nr:hypothetical protein [Curtobacterium flaccumfaciens]MBO9056151.1 hypothetical protein [Curtobacterium flaccumfaciens pv. flaccumfaciens]QVG66902.1 hypothetical protein JG551_000843 [Curtobacterium flaccumfaciens pv. flaccumfaciens]